MTEVYFIPIMRSGNGYIASCLQLRRPQAIIFRGSLPSMGIKIWWEDKGVVRKKKIAWLFLLLGFLYFFFFFFMREYPEEGNHYKITNDSNNTNSNNNINHYLQIFVRILGSNQIPPSLTFPSYILINMNNMW